MRATPHKHQFTAFALEAIPMIQPGDDITGIILDALHNNGRTLQPDDVLVIASKIIAKSEGRFVNLADVTPDERACQIADQTRKDPRIVALILTEATSVSRIAPHVLVTEHRLGFVSANSGIDQSNIGMPDHVLLLPQDPDATARQIRSEMRQRTGVDVAVVISDTHGRPFRLGNVGVAIGIAGIPALVDERGKDDLFGRPLIATVQGYADMLASTAHLLTGEGAEGRPVVILRGLQLPPGDGDARQLNRDPQQDLYR